MRKVLGTGAVALGAFGLLLCATAIGFGWWAAARSTAQLHRVVARLDRGLSEVDLRLAHNETRLNAAHANLNTIEEAAKTLAVENAELPRVRAEIERLRERLIPSFDRVDALAASLVSGAAGLRTAADIVDQFSEDPEVTVRTRNAVDKIDRAAESLSGLRARVEASKSVKAVQLSSELVTLVREAAAGSERLANGLADTRQEIANVRGRMAGWRDDIVSRIYVAVIANTLICLWGGLGQACLIGWGRRPFGGRPSPG